jgi:CheY-like chemotaxis protein
MSKTPPGQFILCVDDDADDHFLLREAIREVDPQMQIMEFHNGADAMKYFKEAKAEHDLPCVMVLDINMPVMDGKETLRRIKADPALAHVQVVVLTTSASRIDKEYFAAHGVEMYTKPVDSEGLKQIAELFVQHCK